MSFWAKLLGLAVWIGVGYYDWWVWHGLFTSNLDVLGALIGFVLLCLLSLPITFVGGLAGLILVLSD